MEVLMDDLVTCLKCGWVHFAVDTAYVDKWEADWKIFWATLDEHGREMYGCKDAPPTREGYYECFSCSGSYKNFRDALPGDSPDGCSIQPILTRHE
jgi:hypothetical protein